MTDHEELAAAEAYLARVGVAVGDEVVLEPPRPHHPFVSGEYLGLVDEEHGVVAIVRAGPGPLHRVHYSWLAPALGRSVP